jgi:hypothetical protein
MTSFAKSCGCTNSANPTAQPRHLQLGEQVTISCDARGHLLVITIFFPLYLCYTKERALEGLEALSPQYPPPAPLALSAPFGLARRARTTERSVLEQLNICFLLRTVFQTLVLAIYYGTLLWHFLLRMTMARARHPRIVGLLRSRPPRTAQVLR